MWIVRIGVKMKVTTILSSSSRVQIMVHQEDKATKEALGSMAVLKIIVNIVLLTLTKAREERKVVVEPPGMVSIVQLTRAPIQQLTTKATIAIIIITRAIMIVSVVSVIIILEQLHIIPGINSSSRVKKDLPI